MTEEIKTVKLLSKRRSSKPAEAKVPASMIPESATAGPEHMFQPEVVARVKANREALEAMKTDDSLFLAKHGTLELREKVIPLMETVMDGDRLCMQAALDLCRPRQQIQRGPYIGENLTALRNWITRADILAEDGKIALMEDSLKSNACLSFFGPMRCSVKLFIAVLEEIDRITKAGGSDYRMAEIFKAKVDDLLVAQNMEYKNHMERHPGALGPIMTITHTTAQEVAVEKRQLH